MAEAHDTIKLVLSSLIKFVGFCGDINKVLESSDGLWERDNRTNRGADPIEGDEGSCGIQFVNYCK